jgi:hypothetical protein
MSAPSGFKWAIALQLAWFPALFIAWAAIAGEAGSPMPDNWPTLERILDILEVSALASFALLVLAPVAHSGASRGARWAAAYPVLIVLNCGGTVLLALVELALAPPPPPALSFAVPPPPVQSFAAPHEPCWRFGQIIPPVDALGKPIRPGDLLVIRPASGSDNPLPDTPGQAAQRKAWQGRVVIAAGTIQGGALRFDPTGADAARDVPQFCLWPDNVEHLRAH